MGKKIAAAFEYAGKLGVRKLRSGHNGVLYATCTKFIQVLEPAYRHVLDPRFSEIIAYDRHWIET